MLEKFSLANMTKGWFIGDFDPSLFKTEAVEVGVKEYLAGDKEEAHFHKISTEFTVIIKGEVKMSQKYFVQGDIIKIEPGVSTDFEAITDVITVVVKLPAAKNDKYLK